jgi:thiamine-monophosphate kinase
VPAPVLPNIDPARYWLGWGDWNVFALVSPECLEKAQVVAEEQGSVVTKIGKLIPGKGEVWLERNGIIKGAPRLESERFAKDSWFSLGIQSYVDQLLQVPLPEM